MVSLVSSFTWSIQDTYTIQLGSNREPY